MTLQGMMPVPGEREGQESIDLLISRMDPMETFGLDTIASKNRRIR